MNIAGIVVRMVGYLCSLVPCEVQLQSVRVPRLLTREQADNIPPELNVPGLGTIRGLYKSSLRGREFAAFEGIPFAVPPVGNLRFKDPIKIQSWGGRTLDATAPGNICLQVDPTTYYYPTGSEDCLYLNVYTPLDGVDNLKPVMVWIHGGGFIFGAGAYYGPIYLMDKDVIVVTINYRLGPLGFFSTGDDRIPGNMGLKDQSMAINWVYDNIRSFGGDPQKITIFGESAGGASSHLQMMNPAVNDKIYSVISMSGNAMVRWTFPETLKHSRKIASSVNCRNDENILNCLQNAPARSLVWNQVDLYSYLQYPLVLFGPVLEKNNSNAFITQHPTALYKEGKVPPIPFMVGNVKDDGLILALTLYITGQYRRAIRNKYRTFPPYCMYSQTDSLTTDRAAEFYELTTQNSYLLDSRTVLRKWTNMGSDCAFNVALDKAIDYHYKYGNSPVYTFSFDYEGQRNPLAKFNIILENLGVVHTEDVFYLFNSTKYSQPLSASHPDFAVADMFQDFVTSFAKNREPRADYYENTFSAEKWMSVSNSSSKFFYKIDKQSSMGEQPHREGIQFWKTTPYH